MNIFFQLRETRLGKTGYALFCKFLPPVRVWRRVWGLKVYFDLRDCLFYLAMSRRELQSLEGPVLEVLKQTEGPVWDVGCNVGLFSLYCASQGRPVTAFDISDKRISLLEASAKHNNLNIRTVSTALSVESFEFIAPASAHTMNKVVHEGRGVTKTSISFDEAAARFGIPRLIKMDIEGAELDFFRSDAFKNWVVKNNITMLVEVHSDEAWGAIWKNLPFERLDERHVLIFPKGNKACY